MERRMALASAVAAAVTLGIGTVTFASLGGGNLLGMAGDTPSMVPASTNQVVTRVVVVVGPDGSVTGTSLVTETLPMGDTVAATEVVPAPTEGAAPAPQVAPQVVPWAPAPGTTAAATTNPWEPSSTATTAAPNTTSQAPQTTHGVTTQPDTTHPNTTQAPGTVRPTTTVPTTTPAPVTTAAHVTTTAAPETTVATTPPTTAAAVTTTTAAPATSSTLPRGVPADWPAGKPIPPKPPNCANGKLEDNGVWNCEH